MNPLYSGLATNADGVGRGAAASDAWNAKRNIMPKIAPHGIAVEARQDAAAPASRTALEELRRVPGTIRCRILY